MAVQRRPCFQKTSRRMAWLLIYWPHLRNSPSKQGIPRKKYLTVSCLVLRKDDLSNVPNQSELFSEARLKPSQANRFKVGPFPYCWNYYRVFVEANCECLPVLFAEPKNGQRVLLAKLTSTIACLLEAKLSNFLSQFKESRFRSATRSADSRKKAF